jgi:hypothetical protein
VNRKIVLAALLLVTLGTISARSPVVPQGVASGMFAVSPTLTLAYCEANYIAGQTNYCPLGNGQIYFCLSTSTCSATAGWVQIGGAPAAGVTGVTVNGVPVVLTSAGVAPITVPTKAVIPNGVLQ